MLAAQNEARVAAQGQIFPEHMVLGLLTDPDAFAAKAIVTQGVTLEAARRAVAETYITVAAAAVLYVREQE